MGPFQNTVWASASFEAYSSRVFGPMSRPSWSAGILSASTVLYWLGALVFRSGNSRETRTSTGSSSSTPSFSARSMYSVTAGIWSSWRREMPTS